MKYREKNIGTFNGEPVSEIELINDLGNSIVFWSLGARINEFNIRSIGNIILSYKDIQELLNNRTYYFGATIGRVAGRITNSKFTLSNIKYQLDANEGVNHLHGGKSGYDLRNWSYEIKECDSAIKVIFSLLDKEKNNYYPGDLEIKVIHSFNNDNEWTVEYRACSNKDTIVNPTNHVYFNLNGEKSSISNHLLQVPSTEILETNDDSSPNGKRQSVLGTDIDFNKTVSMEKIFESNHPEVLKNKGLDTIYVLDNTNPIILENPSKNINLEINTDRTCLIVYTLNKINDDSSMDLCKHQGIALETQLFPDAINHEDFGNIILKKGNEFYSKTVYKVKAKRNEIIKEAK